MASQTTTIFSDQPVVTLVNVFTVERERQQELVDVLVEATESVMNKVPGFVSANIHRALDGTRVVNYAQWRSVEAFKAMLEREDARSHMARAEALAKAEPHLYEVVFTDHA